MKPKTTFEKCLFIRRRILEGAAKSIHYPLHYNLGKMMDELSKLNIFHLDPYDLTEDELKEIGFKEYEKGKGLYLIPAWLLPYLKEKFRWKDIRGDSGYSRYKIDKESRFGLLAYGIIIN